MDTRQVRCGDVLLGGGAPVSVQSMTNADPRDERAVKEQIAVLKDAGCQIVRMAVPDMESAQVLGRVKKTAGIPIVADIHFDYRLALAAIKAGADKIRINPGNIGSTDRMKAIVTAARERDIPLRIGVNSGSLERDIVEKYKAVTAEGLAESALRNIRYMEDMDYGNLVVSIKSSDVTMNYKAHKILSAATDVPVHIGITEAGTPAMGKVKSAIGLGALLLEGIGDTMRVSLTADPVEEVKFAIDILKALGLRRSAINLVSCPTCGRTKIDLQSLAGRIEDKLAPIQKRIEISGLPGITVAVMGCVVNGPGEAKEADFGVCGGDGQGLIFQKGQIVEKVKEEELADRLLAMIEDHFRSII